MIALVAVCALLLVSELSMWHYLRQRRARAAADDRWADAQVAWLKEMKSA